MLELTREDKGRHVEIKLKFPNNLALGSSVVKIKGKIVRVGKDFIDVDVGEWTALPHTRLDDLKRVVFPDIEEIKLFAK